MFILNKPRVAKFTDIIKIAIIIIKKNVKILEIMY